MRCNMDKRLSGLLILALVTVLTGAALSSDHSEDEVEIRNLQTRQAEAWNRHDARAYAKLFTEDGDVVNVLGWWWKGRVEIEKKLTEAYVFVFRESTLTINEVDVRFLTPQIAVAHVRWSMAGARTPAGNSDADTAKAGRQMVDCRFSKYQRRSRKTISPGSTGESIALSLTGPATATSDSS